MKPTSGRLLEIAAYKQTAACHQVSQKIEKRKGAEFKGSKTPFHRESLLR
jgi:hypothetical protein